MFIILQVSHCYLIVLITELLTNFFIREFSAAYEELNCREPSIKIGWFCPESISGTKSVNDPDDVKAYIETSLTNSLASKHTFILAPYVEE